MGRTQAWHGIQSARTPRKEEPPRSQHPKPFHIRLLAGTSQNGVPAFLGVPYAAPPVGERRFAIPAPHPIWDGSRDATQPGPSAPQFMRPFPKVDVSPLVGQAWQQGDDFLTAKI